MGNAPPPYIGVVGPGEPTDEEATAAAAVGRLLAARGAVIVCGGLGGVMEAVARGAAENDGTVVGILPGTDRAQGNVHLTVALPTGMGEMRNALIVRAADAVLAIGGAYGTLTEIAFALRTGVPVVGIATWDLADIVTAPGPAEAVEIVLALAAEARAP
jgi:uncharacterized protein (TIGR00725 family)